MHLGLAGVWKSSFVQRYLGIDCGVGVLFLCVFLFCFFHTGMSRRPFKWVVRVTSTRYCL